MKRFILFVLVATVALFAAVDVRVGDLRFSAFNKTLRHWSVVAQLGHEACAFPVSTGNFPCVSVTSTPAGSYTLVGSGTGLLNVATVFTEQATGNLASPVTTTPSDLSHGGIFSPTSVVLPSGAPAAQTFNYTPLQTGSWSITSTNAGSLIDPSPVAYSVSNASCGYPGFTSGWNSNAVTLVTGGASDPFGGSNTATITEDNTTNFHFVYCFLTPVANQSYTYSVMAHSGAGTARNVEIGVCETVGFTSCLNGAFNPATCAFVADLSNGANAGLSAHATRSLSGGWCLMQITGVLGNFTASQQSVALISGTTESYLGNGSSLKFYGPVVQ